MVQQTTEYLLITWFPLNKRAANRIFTWLSHVLILRKYWQEKSHYLPFYCMESSILVALITIFQMNFVLCSLICLHVCVMQIELSSRMNKYVDWTAYLIVKKRKIWRYDAAQLKNKILVTSNQIQLYFSATKITPKHSLVQDLREFQAFCWASFGKRSKRTDRISEHMYLST